MMEQMTINDLKTGMHVVLRNGDEMIVMKGAKKGEEGLIDLSNGIADDGTFKGTWCDLSFYNDNMTHFHYDDDDSMSKYDIVKVYDIAIYDDAVFTKIKDNHDYDDTIIYVEEVMTKAEAEKKFGIRIVD